MKILLKSVSSILITNPNLPFLKKRLGAELAHEINMSTVPRAKLQPYTGLDTASANEIYYIFMHPNFDLVRDFQLVELKPLAQSFVDFMNEPSESNKRGVRRSITKYLASLDAEFMRSREIRSFITDIRRLDFGVDTSVVFREHNDFYTLNVVFPEGNVSLIDHTMRLGVRALKETNTLWEVQIDSPFVHQRNKIDPSLISYEQQLKDYLISKKLYIGTKI